MRSGDRLLAWKVVSRRHDYGLSRIGGMVCWSELN